VLALASAGWFGGNMAFDPISGLFSIGETIIDKIWPDAESAAEAKQKMIELQLQGELRELETRFNAITAEASSQDKWTSRARPSFMYVIYMLILAAVPYGFATIFAPEKAILFADVYFIFTLQSVLWFLRLLLYQQPGFLCKQLPHIYLL